MTKRKQINYEIHNYVSKIVWLFSLENGRGSASSCPEVQPWPRDTFSLDLDLLFPWIFTVVPYSFWLFSIQADAHYVIPNSATLLSEVIEILCDIPAL